MIYTRWAKVPEHLKTKTQLKRMGLKPAKTAVPEAHFKGQYGVYELYNVASCVPIQKRQVYVRDFDINPNNVSDALYIINKSAKVSRDTKNKWYSRRNHALVQRAKDRERELYRLKDSVLRCALEDGWATILGIHIQELVQRRKISKYDVLEFIFHEDYEREFGWIDDEQYFYEDHYQSWICDMYQKFEALPEAEQKKHLSDYAEANGYEKVMYIWSEGFYATESEKHYLLLIKFGKHTFHRPASSDEIEQYPLLGDIGTISPSAKKIDMKFTEAKTLLERYVLSRVALSV